ncbi:Gfo/Idh/MocA family oxidoreductase [Oceanispirochaeta crateris]|uniref:Gfo/Idh/MocA family oxidoreductase n=1 Tax=Oceanispirochaeta crateris TaxID=2518645 RepID=A0A5C1QQP5_9SPIO|nr:Gfo/Idh/MocA family oxidoreductase [Oceanispirochaeta crateris]QEN09688.1 Gfo/Idh/MocA family oxidoreductase [Oceanispirochaeta crateris]
MNQKSDGANYAPVGKPNPVCKEGEFIFSVIGLEHGHIYGMCNGLIEAGAQLKWVYDQDPLKMAAFSKTYGEVKIASSEEEILNDPSVQLIAGAAITSERCALGMRVMDHGKDYFTDKAPLTTLKQLEMARNKTKETGLKYAVYFSERLHVESAVYAGHLIEQGAIGRVLQVLGTGPHRLGKVRPDWFWNPEQYGGILCDIGSHQIEQFLHFAGVKEARIAHSQVANYNHKEHPGFNDFGDAVILGDNGATQYFRVDWFTPDGLSTWGDGRTTILGTEGYIELRKYVDICRDPQGDQVYLVDGKGEHHFSVSGTVGYPFFGQLILDCLHRTENAMTQEHAFKAAELAVMAQNQAVVIE